MRFGAGIWLFGQFVDRYATDAYGPPVSTGSSVAITGLVPGVETRNREVSTPSENG